MTTCVPSFEPLEGRVLLSSVLLNNRHLTVRGETDTGNNISVSFDGAQKNVILNLNGTVFTYKTGAISLINLVGGNGNDYLHVDQLLAPFSIRTRFFPGEGDNAVVGGNEHDNFICGGSGDDSIFAGNGDDTIVGGTGNDTMVVGRGFKLIFGAKGDNTITTDHGRGYIFGGNGTNTITSAGDEYEIFGGPGDDILRGGEFDTLWGQGGHDTLVGGLQRKYTAFKGIAKLRRILFPTIPVV